MFDNAPGNADTVSTLKGGFNMAVPRMKPTNLALLIRAIAEAYHRDANGRPIYQQIAFRTGGVLSSATVHLWKHGGVKSVTGVKVHALVNAYDLDFARVLALIYGPPTKLSGDDLLASLRPEIKRARPIGGGSHGLPTLSLVEVLEEIVSYQTWRRWLAWVLPFPWVTA